MSPSIELNILESFLLKISGLDILNQKIGRRIRPSNSPDPVRTTPASSDDSNYLVTESGDFLITESGNFLITE